ncbi:MFS domain-containing protein [Physcia stellaris]|nr:MFS domain-containing protein [Physcia stellaris]
MGQTSSTTLAEEEKYSRERADWLKPITSRDQLVQRYRGVLSTFCLSFEERSWLEQVFDKHASQPGLFLGVGSFPYHQDPVKELDLGTLRTAVVLLLGNDEQNFPLAEDEEEEGEGENERAPQVQARYTRILFQSLAPSTSLGTGERSERNDEDIKETLRIVSKRRILRHPHTPKIGTPAPQLPSPSSLPPSHAELLNGRLTQADLQALIRLFLACQLHWADTDPERILASSLGGLEKVTDATLGAFDLDQDGLCGWQSFHRVMEQLVPDVQSAMACILNSFIEKPESICNEDEPTIV